MSAAFELGFDLDPWRHLEAMYRPAERWASPGELAMAIDPHTIQTPALDLIDEHLVRIDRGDLDRLIISMPPQEGKSTRVTKQGALWFLTQNKDRRIAIVSYDADLATTFGRDIRSMITQNSGDEGTLDLGLRIRPDNGAVHRWTLAGHRGGVRSVGINGGITGRSADLLIIDDPIKNREQADSATYRQRVKDFWTSTAGTRLAPGAPVIIVQTRWHEDDLAGWLLSREDGDRWTVINIEAQAETDDDVLGRKPGEYMVSARINEKTGQTRGPAEWEAIKIQAGPQDWAALYQGRPTPAKGDVIDKTWFKQYDLPLWEMKVRDPTAAEIARGEKDRVVYNMLPSHFQVMMSWDMTFKNKATSDFVVGQVWATINGIEAYLLDQVRGRWDFNESAMKLVALAKKWPQAGLKLVEDAANGPAIISVLQKHVAGLVPEPTRGLSKLARAKAVTPFMAAGNVWIPSETLAPWVGAYLEEMSAFPNGVHDDQVDATSQALNRIYTFSTFDTETQDQQPVEPEEFSSYDLIGYAYTPF